MVILFHHLLPLSLKKPQQNANHRGYRLSHSCSSPLTPHSAPFIRGLCPKLAARHRHTPATGLVLEMQKRCGPSARDCGVRGVGAEMREEWEEIGLQSATLTAGFSFFWGRGPLSFSGQGFRKIAVGLGREAVFKDRAPFIPNT